MQDDQQCLRRPHVATAMGRCLTAWQWVGADVLRHGGSLGLSPCNVHLVDYSAPALCLASAGTTRILQVAGSR